MSVTNKSAIQQLSSFIKKGKVTVFTGAGMSTASGLPDFRSAKDGMWGKIDPAAVASTNALHHNYDLFKKFYKMRLNGLEGILPNNGHIILSNWEKKGLLTGLITQNVDGLHDAAGSQKIATLHGRLRKIFCQDCKEPSTIEDFMNDKDCPKCHGKLRPGVVLFGEMLPEDQLDLASKWTNECNTFIVLGSSLQVSPANSFPQLAKMNKAKLVIINRDPTDLDYMADLVFHDPIVQVLEETDKAMENSSD